MADGYPRLLDGIAMVPVENGYAVEGHAGELAFTGRIPALLFGPLLPWLDGRLSTAAIAEQLGAPYDLVRAVVGLLGEHGLLRELTRPADGSAAPGSAQIFLRRSLGHDRAEAVRQHLQQARVAVLGENGLADLISSLLRQSEIGTVTRETADPAAGSRPDFEVVVGRAVPPAAQSPQLPVRRAPGKITIGPVTGIPGACCWQCGAGDDEPGDDGGEAGLAGLLGVAAGVAAGAVVRILAGYGSSGVWNRAIEVPLPDAIPRPVTLRPRPACPACRQLALAREEFRLLIYEHVEGASVQLADPVPEHAGAQAVSTKHYLTEPRQPARDTSGPTRTMTQFLCRAVGGRRGSGGGAAPRRWTPAVGPPGSSRAYARLPDGSVRYFDGHQGQLVELAGPAPGSPPGMAACLTGDLTVMTPTFGAAARHLLDQDAGLALAALFTCARRAGWTVHAARTPDDQLSAVLDLDHEREVITALVRVAAQPGSSSRRAPARLRLPRAQPQNYRFAQYPVPAGAVVRAVARALSQAARIWPASAWRELGVQGLLYARNVSGLAPGLYECATTPRRVRGRSPLLEELLRHRDLGPAALLLFTGEVLAGDPLLQAAMLQKTAAAAGLAQAAMAGSLSSGLVARMPAAIAAIMPGAGQEHRHVVYGCLLGYPDNGRSARTHMGESMSITW